MSIIIGLCEQIVQRLTASGSPIARYLLPGISERGIREVEAKLPFVFPDAIVEMYKWHNGTELVAGTTFYPWWVFDTITESTERYKILIAPQNGIWAETGFNIFSSSDISALLGLFVRTHQRSTERSSASNILGIMEWSSLVWRRFFGLYLQPMTTVPSSWRAHGELDEKPKAFAKLARKFNPGITRWG